MMIKDSTGNKIAFIEKDCKLKIDGHEFSYGGAWLCKRVDTGKYEGWLYMYEDDKTYTKDGKPASCRPKIGSWDGSIKISCYRGKEWFSNFGDKRQSVWFKYNGHYFYGVHYSKGFSDLVKVREIKTENYY